MKKTINTYLKLKIRVACREFLAFKYVVIVFFETKQMIMYILVFDFFEKEINTYLKLEIRVMCKEVLIY